MIRTNTDSLPADREFVPEKTAPSAAPAASPGWCRAIAGHWPLAVVLVAGSALSVEYIARTIRNMVYLDAFIQVPYVGDWLSGRSSFWSALFTTPWAGEHLLLGYRLWSLINAKFFGLNLELDPVVFLVAYAVIAIVVYLECRKIFRGDQNWQLFLWFLPLGFLCFSLVQPVGQNMSAEFACGVSAAVVIAWLIERDWNRSSARRWSIGWAYACALLGIPIYFLFLSGAYFPGIVLGLGVMYLFRALLERKWLESKTFVTLGILVASSLVYTYFLVHVQKFGGEASGGVRSFAAHPGDAVLLYLAALTGGSYDNPTIDKLAPATVALIGAGMALILIIALVLFVRTKMYRATYLPIFCIFYTLGVATSVYAARQQLTGWEGITAEWYAPHLRPAVIGIVWILLYAARSALRDVRLHHPRLVSRKTLPLVFVALALSYIGIPQIIGNVRQWNRGPSLKGYFSGIQDALLYPNFYSDKGQDALLWPAAQVAIDRAILMKYHLTEFGNKSLAGIDFKVQGTVTHRVNWLRAGWAGPSASAFLPSPSNAIVHFTLELPKAVANSSDVWVRVNNYTVFDQGVVSGRTYTFSGGLGPGGNKITVEATKSALIRVGSRQRVVAVNLDVSATF